jgi:hypothetical protein
MRYISVIGTIVSLVFLTETATAGQVLVTPENQQGWGSFGNQNGGSSVISSSSFGGAFDDGSLRLTGDRTRFGVFETQSGFGLLRDVEAVNFQWVVEQVGGGVTTAQAPALRLHVLDTANNRNLEIIWEDGEQSVPERQFVAGEGSLNTIYSGDFFGTSANQLHVWTTGLGRGVFDSGGGKLGSSDQARNFETTRNAILSVDENALVLGISVGAGSSIGSGFIGYADLVQLTIGGDAEFDTTYNFSVAPVPEPSTFAGGALASLLLVAYGWNRRRRACQSEE